MANTLQTTGETMTVEVSAYDYSLFTSKLEALNKNLVKWGLTVAQVLSREYRAHDLSTITGHDDDAGTTVYRWHMTVEIPVATTKIAGHTLIGVIEDLGKGQRLLNAIAGDLASLPACPVERDAWGDYATPEDEQLGRTWFYGTYLPALEALKAENSRKLETLREAPQVCAHCGTTRRRKSVLVFEKTDGSLIQIGKDCAKEYLGVDLERVLQGTWDLIERSGGTPKSYHPEAFRVNVASALYLITRYGYVSNKVAESYQEQAQFVPVSLPLHVKTSTREMLEGFQRFVHEDSALKSLSVADLLLASGEDQEAIAVRAQELTNQLETAQAAGSAPEILSAQATRGGFRRAEALAAEIRTSGLRAVEHYAFQFLLDLTQNPDAYASAMEEVMNFWANLTPDPMDEFTKNVKAVAMAEANKSAAMTGMVVLKWLEATKGVTKGDYFRPEHKTKFPALPEARTLAAVGEKVDVVITITERRCGATLDGAPWHLLKGRTAENLEVTLFCKQAIYDAGKEGQELHLRAKVKGHETYKDRVSTALFYAKVVE